MEPGPTNRNGRSALLLSLVVAGMFGFGFALVPLYGFICEVTGIQTAAPAVAAARVVEQASDRFVTVKFDANVKGDLPWAFAPEVRSMRVPVGKLQQTSYRATNLSGRAVAGQAVPAVVPWQATTHFSKTDCFCFRRQTLEAGETRDMPLAFLITPDLPATVDTLTLSYTFMNADGVREQGWELLKPPAAPGG